MNRTKIDYHKLNSRAQENYNADKLGALMADYGYHCMRLSDDYNGADMIALREGEEALHIQLKGRVMIKPEYMNKGLYIAFPINGEFYVLLHDTLVDICGERGYLNTRAWLEQGKWHVGTPPKDMILRLQEFKL